MCSKHLLCGLLLVLMSSCTFNVRIVKEPDIISEATLKTLTSSVNQYASLSIGDAEIPCKIVGANEERLIVASREVVSEIPVKALNKIFLYGAQKGPGSSATAMLIAGITAGFLGDLAGREIANDKNNKKEIRIGSAILGACAGMIAIRTLSKGVETEIVINKTIKAVELYPGIGKSLTSEVILSRNLFNDLSMGAGETLLKLKVYQYEPNQYIAVYEVHDGKETIVKWVTFDETYFKQQRAKLEQPLKDQIFKNSSLNGQ
ncbi:hypothetical protein F9K33_00445 [bacterium]|nr:MAG: hypothetical protein F9K33_00445 [bacterium]